MAYYSKLRPTVYHEYKNCHVGNNLVKENLKRGKRRGARLCQTCERLSLTGKGVPGTPKLSRLYKYAAVMAYYSKEHPRPKIYHVCQNCYLGQHIEAKYLVEGKPKSVKGRKKPRVCKVCARLCSAGEGIPGAPIPSGGPKPTKAYYSKLQPDIYHVCRHCYLGKRITKRNMMKGHPKKAKLCANCVRMCINGECILGTPIFS
jgi:hypothetical protein